VTRDDYTSIAKSLHWLIAIFVFILFPLAWIMDDFSGLQKFKLYNLHKSLGITVLTLMVLRVFWRFVTSAPSLPESMPVMERRAAHLGHFALYILLFLMPLTGWAMISASDKPSVLYQFTAFPRIPWLADLPIDQKKSYEELFQEVHAFTSYILLAFVSIHIAAALRHAFVLKDGILSRMLPRFGKARIAHALLFAVVGGAGLAVAGVSPGRAEEWSINPAASRVGFEATGGGYTTRGTFSQYKTDIQFDPDAPELASIRVLLNMKSVTTGTGDVDSTLQSADYFNTSQFPTAQFVAKGAKLVSDGKYVLQGQLTLKGVTRPVALPFSVDIDSGSATVNAETKINRMDFGVGPESVEGLAVDKVVKLTFNLKALRLDN